MVGEIKGPSTGAMAALEQANSKTRVTQPAPAAPPVVGASDRVDLTSRATQLQALTRSVADLPQVDRSAVLALREDLSSGTYEIQPASVADKFIQYERALLAANQG